MKITSEKRREKLVPYLFIAPFIIAFIVFFVIPSGYSLVLSFFKYKGYGTAKYVGIDNYNKILHYGKFWTAVYNTLFYYLLHLLPVMVISFLISVAIYSGLGKLGNVYKPVIYLSQVMPTVAAALVFKVLLSTRTGVVNTLLGTSIPFLEDNTLMKYSVTLLAVWRGMGWFVVIFCSGLTSINPQVIEAAKIDGASSFQILMRVIIPLMRPIFLFAFVMDSITSFKIYTEPTVLLETGNNMAPPAGISIVGMLAQYLNQGNFGSAAAVGWILFVIIFIFYLLENKILKGDDA